MHANVPIVKELMIVRQLFVNNSYAGFHENLVKGLAADTRTWFPHKVFFFLIRIKFLSVRNLVPANKLLRGFSRSQYRCSLQEIFEET
jgi:hypothetical protein